MSYQALYRKYRPATFDEVVGQQAIIQTLKNAVVQDRIAHAYLFCGPRGTGKTSIAKIFARMLNCTSENHNQPCGYCENCNMAISGSHPDIIEIDAASNNGVDEVRDLIDRVKYAPMQGKYKIYIVDEVHMMTPGAFNALLKTIEEPPEHVIFIFATTEPNKVIPTIISRCQRFDFSKVSQSDIEKRLNVVCQSEKINIDQEALSLIASLSDGGMRDSLSILDQCVAYCSDAISTDDVRKIYGVVTSRDIAQLFQYLYKRDIDSLIRELEMISNQGMDLKRLTSDFISLLKNSIIYDYSSDTTLINENTKSIIREYIVNAPLSFRMNVLNELMETYHKFVYASNLLDYLEVGLLRTLSKSYDSKSKHIEEETNKSEIHKNTKSHSEYENKHDKTSEISEKKDKKEKISDKIVQESKKEAYDVSRETFKQSENENSKIILEDGFVIQLLVGADKKERQADVQKYENRTSFLSESKYKRAAILLKQSSIIASGDNYIVISVRSDVESKEINEYQNKKGFESFITELLGKTKKVFSIDHTQQNRVFNEFKEKMIQGMLPEPAIVVVQKKNNIENSSGSTEEEELKKYFPDLLVKKD